MLAPPVVQVEVHPLAADDSGATGSDAPVVDSPTWAERVKMQGEELRAMSTSSKKDCYVSRICPKAPPPAGRICTKFNFVVAVVDKITGDILAVAKGKSNLWGSKISGSH